jgi:hypothetical protein
MKIIKKNKDLVLLQEGVKFNINNLNSRLYLREMERNECSINIKSMTLDMINEKLNV